MKAKCIAQQSVDFTYGKVYDVSHIDDDGDIWVHEDDFGEPFFFFPFECELIED